MCEVMWSITTPQKFERKFDIGELGPIIDLDRYGYPERDSELDYILVDGTISQYNSKLN